MKLPVSKKKVRMALAGVAAMVQRVSSFGTSALSMLFLLVEAENQLSGGVSTASIIPL